MAKRCDNCKPDLCLFAGGGSGGGGGGDSVVRLFNVTLNYDTYPWQFFVSPIIINGATTILNKYDGLPIESEATVQIPSFSDTLIIHLSYFDWDDSYQPTLSGNVVMDDRDNFIITGDCSITLHGHNYND